MLASDGVYVSGEVANVRMSLGRGVFTGVDHAYHTGVVAGRNMAGVFDVYDHIPIYEATAEESDIHLTTIGHCSAAFETHGFWWRLGGPSTSSSASASSNSSSLTPSGDYHKVNNSYTNGNTNSKISNGEKKPKPDVFVPVQETLGERMRSELYGIFGYKAPIRMEKYIEKIVDTAPKGKLNVRRSADEGVKNKLQPPLGLGVLIYVDNDIVVGVLISGAPLSKQRAHPNSSSSSSSSGRGCSGGGCGKDSCGCKTGSEVDKCQAGQDKSKTGAVTAVTAVTAAIGGNGAIGRKGVGGGMGEKTGKAGEAEEISKEEQDILSYSEKIHDRARSLIGRPMSAVAATMLERAGGTADEDGFFSNEVVVSDFRSGRLIRLQNLSEVAGYIIAPAILADSNDEKVLRVELMKAEYKRISSQLPRPNYRYSASSRTVVNAYLTNAQNDITTFAPTIMQENVFSVGGDLTSTRAERLQAAYASGLKYGIDGPPKT